MPQSVLDLDSFNNAFDQFQQEQQGRHDATGTGERLAANLKEGLWNLQGAGAGLVGAKQARKEAVASEQASQLERGASADTTGERIVGSAIQSSPMTVASFLPAGLARIPAARVAAGQVLAKAAARGMAVESAAVQRVATLAAQKAADQAARLGMAGSMGAMSAPDAYDQAKQAGVSDDKALANAIAAAFTEGGVSLMFPKGVESAMLTRAPVTGIRQALTQGAKSLAHGAVDEGIEEGVTEAAHVAHEQALGVNNQPLFSDQNLSRVGEAAAAGGLMGPAFEGMGTAQDLAGAIRDVMRQGARQRSADALIQAAINQAAHQAALSPDNAIIAPAPMQATLPMLPPGPLPQDYTPPPMPADPAPVEPGPGGYPELQPGGLTAADSAAQLAQAFASLPPEAQHQVAQGVAGLFQPPAQAAQEVPRVETIPPAPATVAPGPVPGVAPAPAGAPAAPAPVARQQAPTAQPAPVAGTPAASPSASAVAGAYPVGTRVRFTRGAKKGTEATVASVTADGRPVLRTDDGKALGGKFGITPNNLEVVDAPRPSQPAAPAAPAPVAAGGASAVQPPAVGVGAAAQPGAGAEAVRGVAGGAAAPAPVAKPDAPADQPALPSVGSRVRVSVPGSAPWTGTVVRHIDRVRAMVRPDDARSVPTQDWPRKAEVGVHARFLSPEPDAKSDAPAPLRVVGKNRQGDTIEEDQNGVRSILSGGFRRQEAMRRNGDGSWSPRPTAERGEFATVEEERAAAPAPAPAPAPKSQDEIAAEARRRFQEKRQAKKQTVRTVYNADGSYFTAPINEALKPGQGLTKLEAQQSLEEYRIRQQSADSEGRALGDISHLTVKPIQQAAAEQDAKAKALADARAALERLGKQLGGSAAPGNLSSTSQQAGAQDDAAFTAIEALYRAGLTDFRAMMEQVKAFGLPFASSSEFHGALEDAYDAFQEAANLPARGSATASSVLATAPAPQQGVLAPAPAQAGDKTARTVAAADAIANALDAEDGRALDWRKLFALTDAAFGGTQGQGAYTIQDAYEALQLAVNQLIARHANATSPTQTSPTSALRWIEKLENDLPTQTKRTDEQVSHQQFSTPPTYAFLANWVANLRPGEVYLEPQVGTGSLAAYGRAAGAQVYGNELSKRRAALAESLGIQVTTENADHLHAIYTKKGMPLPDVVVMNPPFSATAGRTDKRDLLTGARHIEEAFKLLKPGGRLVAIVGEGMGYSAPAYKGWWEAMAKKSIIRANIPVNGKVYRKFGTDFGTRLLVLDKPAAGQAPGMSNVVMNTTRARGEPVASLEHLATILEGIRRERSSVTLGEGQPPAAQPGGAGAAEAGRPAIGRADDAGPAGPGPVGPGAGDQAAGQPGAVRSGRPGRNDRQPGAPARPGADARPGVAERSAGPVAEAGADGSGSGDRGTSAGGAVADATGRLTTESASTGPIEEEGGSYAVYKPSVSIPGAKPHAAELVESAAMASVQPPATTYKPNLPPEVVSEGKLSAAQLEQVVRAGQAHGEMLPDGTRAGYFIGDGTGVGKGRTIAGILLDNWRQGRRRAVWVSKNGKLAKDALRDWNDVGGPEGSVFDVAKVKASNGIAAKDGVAFLGYDTLKTKSQVSGTKERPVYTGRLKQLVEWLGKDFDGVIAFDEAHMMGNAIEVKGKRGKTKPSSRALAGVALQQALPKARIIYVSATGATEVANLSYAERLGLWGDGTPFADVRSFISQIAGSGIAAMEVVARDLKSLGRYLARSISFRGVGYDRLVHDLTDDQVQVYNRLAEAWQSVLQNLEQALQVTGAAANKDAKAAAKAQFWGTHQRFFNQVMTGLQMPSVIRQMEQDIADGKAIVVQIVNTNAAAQERALAERNAAKQDDEADDPMDLADLDTTPREALIQYLTKSFPVAKFQEMTDEKGNTTSVMVVDDNGAPVEDPDAVAIRDRLIEDLKNIRAPEGPLEQILNTFGSDQVAEVTGRARRVVMERQEDGGFMPKIESRGDAKAVKEAQEFQDDQRRILIFSDAGGTGQSYHASLKAKNQRLRRHYVLQPGWRADSALQGLGRTHRTNQAQPPEFVLVSTNLKAQKRFISSIARRLDQLGALTKGQRQAGSGGLFSASDNLESEIAQDSLDVLMNDLRNGGRELAFSAADFQSQTGLALWKVGPDGAQIATEITIPQFLNRLLSLKTDMQDTVFDAFDARLQKQIEMARQDGTLDEGVEKLTADSVRVAEERTVNTDRRSGATTNYIRLEVKNRFTPKTWDEAIARGWGLGTPPSFIRNRRSGNVFALHRIDGRTDPSTGRYQERFKAIGVTGPRIITSDEMNNDSVEQLSEEAARQAWAENLASAPEFKTQSVHWITGALLPVWDRLPNDQAQVYRTTTDDGRALLGREIRPGQVDKVLNDLGASSSGMTTEQAIAKLTSGETVRLANGWRFNQVMYGGEKRIEIKGKTDSPYDLAPYDREFSRVGVIKEIQNFKPRYFVPTGEEGRSVMDALTASRPYAPDSASDFGSTDQASGDAIPEADRAAAFDMDEPTTEEAPAELAAPTDQAARSFNGTNYRVPPAPLPPEPGKPVQKLADIILDFGKSLTSAGLGQTEFTNAGMRSDQRGVYKPATGQTAIRHNNLDAAAHEIAHRLDDFFPFTKRPEQDAPASEVRQWKKAMKELMPFSYTGSTPPSNLSREGKLAYIRAEGFAEFVRALIVNPEETKQRAPTAYAMLTDRVPGPVIAALRGYSDRVRRFVGMPNAEKTQANVRGIEEAAGEAAKAGPGRMSRLRQAISDVLAWAAGRGTSGRKSDIPDFDAPFMDRVKFGWFDSLWPAVKAYRQALVIKGLDQSRVPIDRDYETLARIGAGLADRMDSMFIDGLVDAENAPRIDPKTGDRMNLEWLIGPAIDAGLTPAQVAAELDAAMAQGVEERTVEEGQRNLRKAQMEAEVYRQALFDENPDDPDIGKKYMAFLKQKVRQAREQNARLTGIAGGLDSDYEQARRALRERREGDPEGKARRDEILRRYRAWANATMDYAVQAGVLGEDRAEALKKTHHAYIDLHRVIEHETASIPMKAFKGSSRLIDNPLVNLMHATWSTIQWADRNRVRRAFVDALSADRGLHQGEVKDLAAIGHEITEDDLTHRDDAGKVNGRRPYKVWVPAGKDEYGKNTVRASWWVFDPAVEASFEAAHAFDNPSAIGELLHGIKRLSQRTITAAPPFLIRQVYRDTVSRLVTTEAGSGIGDLFKGYGKVGGKPVMERYKTSGAGQAGWDERGKEAYQRRLMGVLYDAVHDPNRVVATIKSLGQGYMHLAHESDLLNRRAEFVRAWKEAKKQGMTDFQADLYAAKHARGLMDFAVAGYYAKKINRFVVFFNAGMQAMRRMARALSADHLPTTALRWMLYVGMPTALIYALQAALMDDKDREEWRQRPAEKRDFAWSFKLAPNLWLDVPKPYEWGVMASAIERSLDKAAGHPHALDGYPQSMVTALIPVKPEMMAGSMRPFLEASFNHSVFTGRPIVPYHEANADLDLRKGTANASELGQLLQKALGVDARKIDFLVSSVFGGFGRIATARSSDPGWWAGATIGLTGRSPAWEARDVQWVLDFAEARKVSGRRPFDRLRDKLMDATRAEDGATRDRLAREAREYATKLRGAIEKNPKAFNGPK